MYITSNILSYLYLNIAVISISQTETPSLATFLKRYYLIKMAASSKLWERATCYELGHVWTPSCLASTLSIANASVKYSFKLYAAFYLVSMMVCGKLLNISDFVYLLGAETLSCRRNVPGEAG